MAQKVHLGNIVHGGSLREKGVYGGRISVIFTLATAARNSHFYDLPTAENNVISQENV